MTERTLTNGKFGVGSRSLAVTERSIFSIRDYLSANKNIPPSPHISQYSLGEKWKFTGFPCLSYPCSSGKMRPKAGPTNFQSSIKHPFQLVLKMSTTQQAYIKMRWLRIPALLVSAAQLLFQVSAALLNVTNLSVDGRYDSPLDLSNRRPTLGWQIAETHDCTEVVCPGDRQIAYEVQAAATITDLKKGRLIWRSGKVESSEQHVRLAPTLTRETL